VSGRETGPVDSERQQLTSVTAMEKSLLLALALKWRQQSDNLNSEQIEDLEREIWLSHIHSAMAEIKELVCVYINCSSYNHVVMVTAYSWWFSTTFPFRSGP
jgi:hypothetical protein